MIPSVTTYLTAVRPDTASSLTSIRGGGAVTAAQAMQPARIETVAPARQAAKDSVTISGAALDLSKALNRPDDRKGAVQQERERQQLQREQATIQKRSYQSATKQYPPFMGNTDVLKLLKQTSPALYREILKMIVPPLADLSYADQQMLAASEGGSVKSRDA